MDETEIKADIGRVSLELDSMLVFLFLSIPSRVAACVDRWLLGVDLLQLWSSVLVRRCCGQGILLLSFCFGVSFEYVFFNCRKVEL